MHGEVNVYDADLETLICLYVYGPCFCLSCCSDAAMIRRIVLNGSAIEKVMV